MEANREAAIELRRHAREAAVSGDLSKALRFLERSVRLYQVYLCSLASTVHVFEISFSGTGSRSRITRNEDEIHKGT